MLHLRPRRLVELPRAVLPPAPPVLQAPLHPARQPVPETNLLRPAQLSKAVPADQVRAVVMRPVRLHKPDRAAPISRSVIRNSRACRPHAHERTGDVPVRHLVARGHVAGLAGRAAVQDDVDGAGEVGGVDVAAEVVRAAGVEGQLPVADEAEGEAGDDFCDVECVSSRIFFESPWGRMESRWSGSIDLETREGGEGRCIYFLDIVAVRKRC